MNENRKIGAAVQFTVGKTFEIEHRRRFVANNTRFVETSPSLITYPEGLLILRAVPVPDEEVSLFADQNGWAFHPNTVATLMRKGKLTQQN